jgi:hypothetical protein
MASTACGGNGNGEGASGSASRGGKSNSEPRSEACKGCYRGHGVSFKYPPPWQKTEDASAPLSDLWNVLLVLKKPSDFVQVVGEGESEFGFPASNLAALRAYIVDQLKVFGFRVQARSEKLTIDGRPGLRFRARLSKKAKPLEETVVITFEGKTLYRFECAHRERAAEVERGCAQIVRTFKVGKP